MQLFKTEPREVDIRGKRLTCAVCSHQKFVKREGQLHTALATLLGFDWSQRTATCYVCQECSHIHWFLEP